jgi:hypothetical protein
MQDIGDMSYNYFEKNMKCCHEEVSVDPLSETPTPRAALQGIHVSRDYRGHIQEYNSAMTFTFNWNRLNHHVEMIHTVSGYMARFTI